MADNQKSYQMTLKNVDQGHSLQKLLYLGSYTIDFNRAYSKVSFSTTQSPSLHLRANAFLPIPPLHSLFSFLPSLLLGLQHSPVLSRASPFRATRHLWNMRPSLCSWSLRIRAFPSPIFACVQISKLKKTGIYGVKLTSHLQMMLMLLPLKLKELEQMLTFSIRLRDPIKNF